MRARRLVVLAPVLAALGAACAAAPPPPPEPPPAPSASAPMPVAAPEPPPPETPDDDFRKRPPAIPPRAATQAPRVDEGRLSNGIRVLVVEQKDAPLVSLQAVITFAAHDPAGARSLLAEAVPAAGWKSGGKTTLLGALEAAGGSPLFEGDVDVLHLADNLLGTQLDATLDALAEYLQHPVYDKAAVEEARDKLRERAGEESQRAAISRLAHETLLPNGHAYRGYRGPEARRADAFEGTDDALKRLDAAALARFHTLAIVPASVTFVAAGNVSRAALVEKLERRLGSWKAGGKDAPPPPPALKLAPSVALYDDASADAEIVLAGVSPSRGHKDYAAVVVANQLLGDALRSNLRPTWPRSGGTDPTARVDLLRGEGLWALSVRTAGTGATASAEGILAEIERVHRGTFSEDAFEEHRLAWVRWTETLLERTSDMGWWLSRIATYGLPMDEPGRLRDAFLTLKPDDVKRVVGEYLDKKKLRLVAKGDAKTLREPLGKLGLGTVVVRKVPVAAKPFERPKKLGCVA